MQVQALTIPDVLLVTPRRHADQRGFFSETFSARDFAAAGITASFVQENHSLSVATGVVRGLHYQKWPHAQGKLVRCVAGSAFDVAVDIRRSSPTFGRHVSAVLSAESGTQIWIPEGFAHGFCTLEPNSQIVYKVTDYYAPECDRGIRWDDPALAIVWPDVCRQALLSEKDRMQPLLADAPHDFA